MITIGIIASTIAAICPPTGLNATNIIDTSFTLNWVACGNIYQTDSFNVYRDGILYGTTSSTQLLITGLAANTSYNMTVVQFNSYYTSLPSVVLVVNTTFVNPTVTINTTNFTATALSASVAFNSTNLSYNLTPSTGGSATITLVKNGINIDSYTSTILANVVYSNVFTLTVAAAYGDVYVVSITYI